MAPYSEIDEKTFQEFADLIYDKAGIHLGPHKRALLTSRLAKRMRKLGIQDFRHYYEHIRKDQTQNELVKLLDAISTNVTQFYREPRHFEILHDLARNWEDQGQARFRIWCAAASSGEEPYTIAITLAEALRNSRDARILATDISTQVLETAQTGIYTKKRLHKVPAKLMERYFHRVRGNEEETFRVNSAIKDMIQFKRLNLATPPFPMRGPLDVIFCRNVMIYFDNTVRKHLLDEMYRLLKPGGYLMVGHAESLSGMLSHFKSVEPSVYVK
jgi:chemotaxis protein methyltransferase CheR